MYCVVSNNFLVGEAAVDAVRWAEDRRDELEQRQLELEQRMLETGSAGAKEAGQDEMMLKAVIELLKEILLLLKVVVGIVAVVSVLLVQKK